MWLIILRQSCIHCTNIFPTFQKGTYNWLSSGKLWKKWLEDLEHHQDPRDFYVKPIQTGVIRISSNIVEDGI
jgi:hypothetical protein